jgi:hypothetical protein
MAVMVNNGRHHDCRLVKSRHSFHDRKGLRAVLRFFLVRNSETVPQSSGRQCVHLSEALSRDLSPRCNYVRDMWELQRSAVKAFTKPIEEIDYTLLLFGFCQL